MINRCTPLVLAVKPLLLYSVCYRAFILNKMCDFCNKTKPKNWDNFIPKREFENDSLATEFDAVIKGNILEFSYDAYSCDSSFSEEIEIKFCPMCGGSLNAL
jgi:hypothetical protein